MKNPTVQNSVIIVILARVAVVTTIMALFGNVLQRIIGIINDDYFNLASATSMAAALALLATLTISLLLRGKPIKKRTINILVVLLFVSSLISTYVYSRYFLDNTFLYKPMSAFLIKGEMTPKAKRVESDYIEKKLDYSHSILVYQEFGGSTEAYFTPESTNRARLNILTIYVVLILFYTSTVYFASELLAGRFKKKEKILTKGLKISPVADTITKGSFPGKPENSDVDKP